MSKDNRNFFAKKSSWAHIKDMLLGYYLFPYAQKLIATRRPLVYVDGFSGPGVFDDGEPGSPLIACERIDEALKQSHVDNPLVKRVFIEPVHVKELQASLADTQATVLKESFENMPRILNKLGVQNSNVFLYVDPFGVKYLDMELFDQLPGICSSAEALINFNSFGLLREACRVYGLDLADIPLDDELIEADPWNSASKLRDVNRLDRIMGSKKWQSVVEMYKNNEIDGYEAECQIANAFSERLRNNFCYVLNFPVRLKAGQRPKYRMLHASNHPDGTILMYQSMESAKTELFFLQNNSQMSMFSSNTSSENEYVSNSEVEEKMLELLLQQRHPISLNRFYADFMVATGVTLPFSELKSILRGLEQQSRVKIIRVPATTEHARTCTFMEEKGRKKAWIEAAPR